MYAHAKPLKGVVGLRLLLELHTAEWLSSPRSEDPYKLRVRMLKLSKMLFNWDCRWNITWHNDHLPLEMRTHTSSVWVRSVLRHAAAVGSVIEHAPRYPAALLMSDSVLWALFRSRLLMVSALLSTSDSRTKSPCGQCWLSVLYLAAPHITKQLWVTAEPYSLVPANSEQVRASRTSAISITIKSDHPS